MKLCKIYFILGLEVHQDLEKILPNTVKLNRSKQIIEMSEKKKILRIKEAENDLESEPEPEMEQEVELEEEPEPQQQHDQDADNVDAERPEQNVVGDERQEESDHSEDEEELEEDQDFNGAQDAIEQDQPMEQDVFDEQQNQYDELDDEGKVKMDEEEKIVAEPEDHVDTLVEKFLQQLELCFLRNNKKQYKIMLLKIRAAHENATAHGHNISSDTIIAQLKDALHAVMEKSVLKNEWATRWDTETDMRQVQDVSHLIYFTMIRTFRDWACVLKNRVIDILKFYMNVTKNRLISNEGIANIFGELAGEMNRMITASIESNINDSKTNQNADQESIHDQMDGSFQDQEDEEASNSSGTHETDSSGEDSENSSQYNSPSVDDDDHSDSDYEPLRNDVEVKAPGMCIPNTEEENNQKSVSIAAPIHRAPAPPSSPNWESDDNVEHPTSPARLAPPEYDPVCEETGRFVTITMPPPCFLVNVVNSCQYCLRIYEERQEHSRALNQLLTELQNQNN